MLCFWREVSDPISLLVAQGANPCNIENRVVINLCLGCVVVGLGRDGWHAVEPSGFLHGTDICSPVANISWICKLSSQPRSELLQGNQTLSWELHAYVGKMWFTVCKIKKITYDLVRIEVIEFRGLGSGNLCTGSGILWIEDICGALSFLMHQEKTGVSLFSAKISVVYLFWGCIYNHETCPQTRLVLWKPLPLIYPECIDGCQGDCCGTKLIQCSVLGVAFLHFERLGKHQDTNLDTRLICSVCQSLNLRCQVHWGYARAAAKNGKYVTPVKDLHVLMKASELVKEDCKGLDLKQWLQKNWGQAKGLIWHPCYCFVCWIIVFHVTWSFPCSMLVAVI